MKRLTLLLPIIVGLMLIAAAPTRVRVADRAEYAKYLAWCNETIPVRTEQFGKLKIEKINGQYTDSTGHFKPVEPAQIYWYPVGTRKMVCEVNEVLISKHLAIWKKQRKSSARDFYEWWIPSHGKTGN